MLRGESERVTVGATSLTSIRHAGFWGGKLMEVAPVKPTISADLLDRLDIRVGTIERVEDVKGSDKLVRLTVDFGDHRRRVLVGMKQERANPREIEGKQALFVVNLPPKKMMGELSDGILLDIGYADGIIPVLAVPETPVPNGSRAG
jgi:tRNA-binding protein